MVQFISMQEDLDKILKFQEERDWKQFHSPKNLAISLSIEASEILELFQWTKTTNLPENKRKELEEELSKSRFDNPKDMICVCPLCHRTIHYGNDESLNQRLRINN